VSPTTLLAGENFTVVTCQHINQGFWRGLGGGGDPFWLTQREGPAAYQNTAVFLTEVNKIPPNFDTLLGTPIWVVWLI